MIARRRTNLHLPPRMYMYKGKRKNTYYTITATNKYITLGHDLAESKRKLIEIEEGRPVAGSIGELIDRYMKEISPKKAPRTHKDEIPSAERLRNVFGKMKPGDLRPVHVAKYLDLRGQNAPVRANREKSLLSHMFSIAMRWGMVDSNPCKGVARNTEKPRDRYVTDSELINFCQFAERSNETGRMLSCVARLAYLTGQRRGDLLRLRLDLLTEEGIMITQSKTKAKVIVQWTAALKECISSLKALDRPISGLYLICNRLGQPYTDSGFKAMWGRAMSAWIKNGNEGFTFHDLRAKAITRMVEDGRKAADLSGHASDEMVRKVYDRRTFKRSKAVE